MKSGDSVVIESRGGPLTYKAIIDGKAGGDIGQVRIPADGEVIARELNDIFFLGTHGEEYTLRGWTGRSKFTLACAVNLVSQKPDEIVVRVDLLSTGTFKILVTDETAKANLRKPHVSYKEKTLDVKRTYTFKPDRVVVSDEVLWLHPGMEIKTLYFTAAFMPGCVQGPARLVKGAVTASFYGSDLGGQEDSGRNRLSVHLGKLSQEWLQDRHADNGNVVRSGQNRTCTFTRRRGNRIGTRSPGSCIGWRAPRRASRSN